MRRGAWLLLVLPGCVRPAGSPPVSVASAVEAPLLAPPVEVPAETAEVETNAPAGEWPFLDQAIGSCVRDALTRTPYLVDWYAQARVRQDGPPYGPRPILSVQMPIRGPVPASAAYDRERRSLFAAWDGPERRSHIMDCTARVAVMRNGRAGGHSRVPYTIYLPADYLDHPQRRRAVLLLASGGAGSRTRWFLPPLRSDGNKRATGGLDMQVRMDAWAAAHPEEPPPLVVSVDGSSEAFVNGMAAFIDHELPDHLLSAYLPHQTREQTPYGVEAVSSGAIVALGAIRANPASVRGRRSHQLVLRTRRVQPPEGLRSRAPSERRSSPSSRRDERAAVSIFASASARKTSTGPATTSCFAISRTPACSPSIPAHPKIAARLLPRPHPVGIARGSGPPSRAGPAPASLSRAPRRAAVGARVGSGAPGTRARAGRRTRTAATDQNVSPTSSSLFFHSALAFALSSA